MVELYTLFSRAPHAEFVFNVTLYHLWGPYVVHRHCCVLLVLTLFAPCLVLCVSCAMQTNGGRVAGYCGAVAVRRG